MNSKFDAIKKLNTKIEELEAEERKLRNQLSGQLRKIAAHKLKWDGWIWDEILKAGWLNQVEWELVYHGFDWNSCYERYERGVGFLASSLQVPAEMVEFFRSFVPRGPDDEPDEDICQIYPKGSLYAGNRDAFGFTCSEEELSIYSDGKGVVDVIQELNLKLCPESNKELKEACEIAQRNIDAALKLVK